MKRLLNIIAVLLIPGVLFAAPRIYGAWGTASDTNTMVTFPWHPEAFKICNTDATDELYYDFTDGVAAATSGGTNARLNVGQCEPINFAGKNPSETFRVGIIAAAGESPDYVVTGVREK